MRKIVIKSKNIVHRPSISRFLYEKFFIGHSASHTMPSNMARSVWASSYIDRWIWHQCIMFSRIMTIFLIQDRWKGPRVYYVFRRTDFFLIHNSWKEQAMYSSLAQAGAIQTGFDIWPILDRIGCFAAPPAVVDSVFSQLIFIHDRTSQPFRSYFQ